MSTFDKISEEVETYQQKVDEAQKEFREKMQTLFTESVNSFFAENPQVQFICWNQYTPYFNDGEPCEFSVREIYFSKTPLDMEDLPSSAYDLEDSEKYDTIATYATEDSINSYADSVKRAEAGEQYFSNHLEYYRQRYNECLEAHNKDKHLIDNCNKMAKIISSNEGYMLDIFGDHVTVFVTKDKSFTEDYDHD